MSTRPPDREVTVFVIVQSPPLLLSVTRSTTIEKNITKFS